MNYIKQLKAFDDWINQNQGSASAQLLWYKLMSINNTCGWVEWFSRTNPSLAGMMNVSENTLKTARLELQQKGLIDFKSGKKKGQPTKYTIFKLYIEDKVSNFDTQADTQTCPKTDTQADTQTAYINKLKRKPKHINNSACDESPVDNVDTSGDKDGVCSKCQGRGFVIVQETFNNGISTRDGIQKCDCQKKKVPAWQKGVGA